MKINHSTFLVTLCAIAMSSGAAFSQTTIYSDDFTDGENGSLNGQAPQVRPGSETWTAGSTNKNTADGGSVTGTGAMSAHLPMPEIDENAVYTLTARVFNNFASSSSNWIALGWTTQTTGTAAWNVAGTAAYWMLWRGNDEIRGFRGLGATNAIGPTGVTAEGEDNVLDLRIILDMPENTVTYLYKDPEATEWSTYASATLVSSIINQINSVGFSTLTGSSAGILSFELTTTGSLPVGALPPLLITQNPDTAGTFDFEWASQPDKLYDLLTSSDLATPIAEWPVYQVGDTEYRDIPSAGAATTLTAVPSADPRRFFALREFDAPAPGDVDD